MTSKEDIRRLARDGTLMKSAYLRFQSKLFPSANANQNQALEMAFMAGALEFIGLMERGMDANDDAMTEEEEALALSAHQEITEFFDRLRLMSSIGKENPN